MTIGRMLDGLLRTRSQIQLVRPRQHDEDQPRRPAAARSCSWRCAAAALLAGLRMGLPATRRWRAPGQTWRPDIVHVVTEGPLGWSALGRGAPAGYSCQLGLPHQLPQLQQALRLRVPRARSSPAISGASTTAPPARSCPLAKLRSATRERGLSRSAGRGARGRYEIVQPAAPLHRAAPSSWGVSTATWSCSM